MKTLFISFLLFVLTISKSICAQEIIDETKKISSYESLVLDDMIFKYELSTGFKIRIILLKTLKGIPIEEYAEDLFETSLDDKTILFLTSEKERVSRIHTGKVVEKYLTDEECLMLLLDKLNPMILQNKFFEGLKNSINYLFDKQKKLEHAHTPAHMIVHTHPRASDDELIASGETYALDPRSDPKNHLIFGEGKLYNFLILAGVVLALISVFSFRGQKND